MLKYKSERSIINEIFGNINAGDSAMPSMHAPSTSPISAPSISPNDDYEGEMAKVQLNALANMAGELSNSLQDNTQLEAWVQSKIAVASEMLTSVYHYMKYKK